MRLLFICTQFPPIENAIGEYVYHLSSQLLAMGYEILVLTGCSSNDSQNNDHVAYHNRINELPLEMNKVNVYPIVKNWNITFKYDYNKIVHMQKPNLVCLQYEPYSFHKKGTPFYLLNIFKKSGTFPLVITFHEVYARNYLFGNLLNYLKAFFQVTIAQKLIYRSIVSFTALDLYKSALKNDNKTCKLFIGSNIPLNQKIHNQNILDFNIKNNTIICFGNKDYIPILLAVEYLTKKLFINVTLSIVGNITEKNKNKINSEIDRLGLKDCVHVFGYCNDLIVENIFRESNIFIDTNYLDLKKRGGTTLKSGSLATAYKYNKLVIGFKGDMTDELLVHNHNIWFCNNSTPKSIASALEFLLNNDIICQKLKQNSVQFYEQNLKWEVLSQKYISNILRHFED